MANYYHFEIPPKDQSGARAYRIFHEGSKVITSWVKEGEAMRGTFQSSDPDQASMKTAKLFTEAILDKYALIARGTLESSPRCKENARVKYDQGEVDILELQEIDNLIQKDASAKKRGLFKALKEFKEGDHAIMLQGWSNWASGWEWREEAKAEFLKRAHYHFESKDLFMVMLDLDTIKELNDGYLTIPASLKWELGRDRASMANLLETALKLWEPKNQDSPYSTLNGALEAADALLA